VRIAAVTTAVADEDDSRADERAVSRFLAGDVAGFETIVRRYSGMVFGLAARLVGPMDAEDVVQETSSGPGASRLRGDSSLKTWLDAIAQPDLRAAGDLRA
jgi:DNA-directed RNA polymerase specialized sigma24 family protein